METVRTVPDLRQFVSRERAQGRRIALIPTMGALHAGHLSLLDTARRHADVLLVSIFVNPRQFGPNEDFARYPRTEASDSALLAEAGCDLLFAPAVTEIYPQGFATNISVAGLGDGLCGAARPGHFDGVATVVCKLLNMAAPDVAVFGEKDWQQLAIIRRAARDLDIPAAIIGSPILRDADGLALSSRNAYLSADERARAVALPRALQAAATAIAAGAAVAPTMSEAKAAVLAAGFDDVDYLALADAISLHLLDVTPSNPARIFGAARLGATRLIDNWPVGA